MTSRLFFALDIPDNILDEVLLAVKEIYGPDEKVKWEKKEKLHITLKFLGDVDHSQIDEIISKLDAKFSERESFSMSLGKFGVFRDKEKNPKIVWVGTKKSTELNKLYSESEHLFDYLGFPREKRKFMPHLTLLRVKGHEDFDILNEFQDYEFDDLEFQVKTLSLIESKLKPGGSEYTSLMKIRFE